ncbi:alpha-(1,3)-fucosyltransferase C [Ciona intestinalis]
MGECSGHSLMFKIPALRLRKLLLGFIILTLSSLISLYSMTYYSRDYETSTRSAIVMKKIFHQKFQLMKAREAERDHTHLHWNFTLETAHTPKAKSRPLLTTTTKSTTTTTIPPPRPPKLSGNINFNLTLESRLFFRDPGRKQQRNYTHLNLPSFITVEKDEPGTSQTQIVTTKMQPELGTTQSQVPMGLDETSNKGKSARTKTILFWYIPFDDKTVAAEFINEKWTTTPNEIIIDEPYCGRCKIIYDRKYIRKSDAIVFHAIQVQDDDLPNPMTRSAAQSYVWWLAESSSTTRDTAYTGLENYFNLTMTVRRSSDIHTPYSTFQWLLKMLWSKENGQDIIKTHAVMKNVYLTPTPDIEYIEDSLPEPNKKMSLPKGVAPEIRKVLEKKNRLVAWVVSNCANTVSSELRHNYAYQLVRSGLNVDQFGNCQGMAFPVESRFDPLFYETLGKYKFYFSFENSYHCKGYITEKLWFNALYSGAVPIVFGPHPRDVAAVLPPKSYIHAEDFGSASELATYIQYLDTNATAYAEYLHWRKWIRLLDENGNYRTTNRTAKILKSYSAEERKAVAKFLKPRPSGFCKLCKRLHEPLVSHVVDDVSEWWDSSERSECFDVDRARRMMKLPVVY